MSDAVPGCVEQCLNDARRLWRQPIVHPEAAFLRKHDSGAAQIRQMPRGFRLRNLQAVVEVTNADFPRREQSDNAKPGGIGQGLEEPIDAVQLRVGRIHGFLRFARCVPSVLSVCHICLDKYTWLRHACPYLLKRMWHTESTEERSDGSRDRKRDRCQGARNQMTQTVQTDMKSAIRDKYGKAASGVATGGCCGGECGDPITANLYGDAEKAGLPKEAVSASLGCGNPTALIDLKPGETVLDLGSGGGIDVLLSAKRVGPTGKVYGLDMTDEMLALARKNQQKAGATNVEFLKGEIEAIPLPDQSVDVVISNCVINLSTDKDRVLREAFRVLKPGGRFAVSDVVVRGLVPEDIRRNVELWVGCVAGALQESDYRAKLEAAGFSDVSVDPWRVYDVKDARQFLTDAGIDADTVAAQAQDKFASAFVRATRPEAKSCCGPTCCS